MNEEKKTMQTQSSAGEYTAPKIKVKELKRRSVICASGQQMGSENDEATFGDE